MEKPRKKNFGYDYKYKCFPDKEALRKFQSAMADYQKWYYQNVIQKQP